MSDIMEYAEDYGRLSFIDGKEEVLKRFEPLISNLSNLSEIEQREINQK